MISGHFVLAALDIEINGLLRTKQLPAKENAFSTLPISVRKFMALIYLKPEITGGGFFNDLYSHIAHHKKLKLPIFFGIRNNSPKIAWIAN